MARTTPLRTSPLRLPALAVAASLALALGLAACGDDGPSGPAVVLSEAGERGKAQAKVSGCVSCHSTDGGRRTGPTWKDLAGSEVTLEGGETVLADDAYLAEAITDPKASVVEGYADVMPTFGGLSDDEVADLVAYLRDLSEETATPPPAAGDPTSTSSTTTGGG